MSSNPRGHALLAPGAPSLAAYAPGHRAPLPAVDERLVAPESHAQIFDGVVVRTMGANPPHATQHAAVTRVFADALAEGYDVAVDMLTRADDANDFAPDVSVFPVGEDAATGGRRLEEIAFEVLDTERLSHATGKAEKLVARGVRRVFCVRVADRTVYEWDHAAEGWTPLDPADEITDRCFRVPVPAGALVNRVVADDVVAKALLASRNGVIERALAESEARGEARGELRRTAALVLRLLARRGIGVDAATAARVIACDDGARLEAWFDRAATATRADEVFAAERE